MPLYSAHRGSSIMLEPPGLERDDDFDSDCALEFLRQTNATNSLRPESPKDLESAVELHSRMSVLKDRFEPQSTSAPVVIGPTKWHQKLGHLCGVRDFLSIRDQWVQVVTSVILGLSALYCDCLAQVYLQQTVNTTAVSEPLIDMGFNLLGYWKSPHAADRVLIAFVGITALRFVIFPGPYAMRWTIIRRWFICMGLLFLLRGMSIICTILPNPDLDCEASIGEAGEDNWNMFVLAWGIVLGKYVTCADVLYSGHTVNFTLAALIWYDYSRLCPIFSDGKQRWIDKFQLHRVFAMTYVMCGYIVIIKTHFHYTVDVWIGFWMTYFVWSYYHEAIKASPFHRGWLMRFLTWLERHATDLRYWRIRVANQFVYDEELRRLDPLAPPAPVQEMHIKSRSIPYTQANTSVSGDDTSGR